MERDGNFSLDDPRGRVVLEAIRRDRGSSTNNVHMLDWIPEQGEDIFDVLVDATHVLRIEIERGTNRETSCEWSTVQDYAKRPLTKPSRRTLEAAIALATDV